MKNMLLLLSLDILQLIISNMDFKTLRMLLSMNKKYCSIVFSSGVFWGVLRSNNYYIIFFYICNSSIIISLI